MPSIDRNSGEPFYQQVYRQIAEGIETRLYPAGKKLPSIRECARDLGVSNTTIELAYQKLTSEGYIKARRGSGYTVCEIEITSSNPTMRFSADYQESLEKLKHSQAKQPLVENILYDFAYDAVDAELFPFATWGRISREVFFSKGARDVCYYNDPQGLHSLRQQIAQHLGAEHDVACIPEQVLVMPTTRDLVASIARLLDPREGRFAMENPGYDEVTKTLQACSFDISWIDVSPTPEWTETLEALEDAKILFTTPACQFPTNTPMPLECRRDFVEWAHEHDAYIIDDEYGWDYLSGVSHMPSLAVFDRFGRVITMGTFSNLLSPAIALSYAVLPPDLMMRWQEAHRGSHPRVPWQTQATMAAFISEGHLHTHARKMRTALSRKRQVLLDALNTYLGGKIDVVASPGSLFALVHVLDKREEADLVAAARVNGVAVYPTSQYWHSGAPLDWRCILVGYAGISETDIEPGVRLLAEAWGR